MNYKELTQMCKVKLSRFFAHRGEKIPGTNVRYSDRDYRIMNDGSFRRLEPKKKNK